jgi:hypothetical protein
MVQRRRGFAGANRGRHVRIGLEIGRAIEDVGQAAFIGLA